MSADEVWRPFGDGRFEASSLGRLRRTSTGHVWKQRLNGRGYLEISVRRELPSRATQSIRVHRAVCEAFHGPAPADRPLALHGNGDPLDNRPENLRWGTSADNNADAAAHGTAVLPPHPVGQDHPQAKLTDDVVRQIRALVGRRGITQQALAERFGLSKTVVCKVVQRRIWTHVEDEFAP